MARKQTTEIKIVLVVWGDVCEVWIYRQQNELWTATDDDQEIKTIKKLLSLISE